MQTDFPSRSMRKSELTGIVGISPWAGKIREQILAASAFPSNVLITGPTGTGKEVISRAIHALGPRAEKPFIPVDCAAIPGALFSSHVFGHLKGAFTGADYAALGCFRAAEGGTIFLDEIGELGIDVQTKLLRVLQQRTVCPVGSHQEIPVEVRVIAATNRDLKREVLAGRFREDLYYRLNVVSLRTAPLRERPEDIAEIARHFMSKLAFNHGLPEKQLSASALRRMQHYDWPGNVRQLENMLERACFSSPGRAILPEDVFAGEEEAVFDAEIAPRRADFPHVVLEESAAENRAADILKDRRAGIAEGRWITMAEVEREHIRKTVEFTNGNRSEAAQLLGMERHQLARKLHKYGLDAFFPKRTKAFKRAA
ncbi:MAG: sigma-54-dependent Fis family transcriptional regulator [Pirellulales bacterium]|nr:sigma-54-dependent Fis family transcriptional regulator [Pirellulales bacterium]